MELKKMVVVKVAVLAFLIITLSSNFADAHRLDARLASKSKSSSSSGGCFDSCICTRSNPPPSQCLDVGDDCHSACDKCFCTKSDPPQCRCFDVTEFCYESCSS